MPLQPVTPSTIGLWRAADWKRGMPGLYALVTGVSAYPWLRGGRLHDPAVDCGGMEQLVSSAATAAALFDWLTSRYRCDGLPLVWCALLLSPTDAERAQLQQQGLTHYGDPSYANLCEAIAQWTGQLPDRPDAAALSRSLFFFSGHGVSANWDPLLLPADYLNQDAGKPRLQNCISTRDLRDWMEDNPVAEHLALIDACRNEFKPLAERGASGHGVFPANAAGAGAPRTAARLASTSPGAVSFSLPDQPATVFGQAVLEALNGMAPTAGPRVEFRELVDYVGPRVTAILREFAPDGPSQVVRQTIDGDD
ncbi:MAG: caspase family protein, partial [Rubrivivax sp.]|nr:caspase family protein [Rubrivivax sp.]